MEANNRWNRPNGKDTVFNATLIGVALLVLAQAVMTGNVESAATGREVAAVTTAAA